MSDIVQDLIDCAALDDMESCNPQVVSGATIMAPAVLDACCGGKMFWFDKSRPGVLYLDKRRESLLAHGRPVEITPDIVGTFTALPFADGSFDLVVFDPPHTFSGRNGWMAAKYGRLEPGWKLDIAAGFAECLRVLRLGGVLVFKWNEHRVKVADVLSLAPQKPLFGQRIGAGKTMWFVFMKELLS